MASTSTQIISSEYVSPKRQRVMGFVFLGIALAILVLFALQVEPGQLTTFKMKLPRSEVDIPNWVFSSSLALNILWVICALLGGYQLARGFEKRTNLVLGLISGMFIFGFLTWATSGDSLNLAGLLRNTLLKAVPITLGAFSGILCERAGVVNIAIEGMMLTGAFVATVAGSLTNAWWGLLAGVLAGGVLAWFHAILSIKYKTDQIISGTVINIFSVGLTSFLSARFLALPEYSYLNSPEDFPIWKIPILSEIPFIGPIMFERNIFVYGMFLFLFVLHFGIFFTRWGLRLRSVGEHPKAADTLGINVYRTRYMAVILGGMMAGFAGSYYTLGSVPRFDELLTNGKGFISLAAMIFGNWAPIGALGASLLFGFADSLKNNLSLLKVSIPAEFLLMAPYIATMIVLAGVVGRGQMPAADGQPYEKE